MELKYTKHPEPGIQPTEQLPNETSIKRKRVHFSPACSDGQVSDDADTGVANTTVDDMLRDLTNLSEEILAGSDND